MPVKAVLIDFMLPVLAPIETRPILESLINADNARTFFNILKEETIELVFAIGSVTFSVPTNTKSNTFLLLKSPKLGLIVV